ALAAALSLDDRNQLHLRALDPLWDLLLLPAQPRHALGHFFHGVGAADRFDRLLLAFAAGAVDLGDVGAGLARLGMNRGLGAFRGVSLLGVSFGGGRLVVLVGVAVVVGV